MNQDARQVRCAGEYVVSGESLGRSRKPRIKRKIGIGELRMEGGESHDAHPRD